MTRGARLAAVLCTVVLLGSVACVAEEGPMMEPGSNCLECHNGGEARAWTFAGTLVGHEQRQVTVVDAAGKTFNVRINQAGNLWSSEPVTFPLRVSVDGQAMPNPVATSGSNCNSCHGFGDGGGGGD